MADVDRPLNKRGKRDAPEMGKRLLKRDVHPDRILCSPAERARATWEAFSSSLQLTAAQLNALTYEPGIYEASAQSLLHLVQSQDDAFSTVLLIGHNPGMETLANELSPEPVGHMPTCALVHLRFDTNHWAGIASAEPTLVYYDYPKKKP